MKETVNQPTRWVKKFYLNLILTCDMYINFYFRFNLRCLTNTCLKRKDKLFQSATSLHENEKKIVVNNEDGQV